MSANKRYEMLVEPSPTETALLQRAGYFRWGHNAWIHVDDEGTVLDTETALRRAVRSKK